MAVSAVLGAQWGDEGKGKLVDKLCDKSDVVARFQGGANAGHTINIGEEEIILHQIPSGIIRRTTDCIMGNGMVVDPVGLLEELAMLEQKEIDIGNRLYISQLAHIVTPLHKALDSASEFQLGKNAIGTTKRGIGPCYADKVSRSAIRGGDIDKAELLRQILESKLKQNIKRGLIGESARKDLLTEFDIFYKACKVILPYITDTISLIHEKIEAGKNILIEGAQGSLLDIDFGSYPFVTSSNTTAGNISTGLGIGPKNIEEILGVFKAYLTRVGAGPFPTELNTPIGEHLQSKGAEFGATTRRKRRCGWFDGVLAKYTVRVNGFTSIAVTKLDVLSELDEIKICTHYENGDFPATAMKDAVPVYKCLPGWQTEISHISRYEDLPVNAKKYLDTLEELLGVSVSYISVGKERNQIIEK